MDDYDCPEPVGWLEVTKCEEPTFPIIPASYPKSGFIPGYGTLEYFEQPEFPRDAFCKYTALDGTVEWCTQVYYG